MNAEQAKLVENNHGLIFSFLKRYNLSVDDYYGVAAIALCKAAMTYSPSKYNFSTYSYRCMYNAIVNEKKAEKVRKHGGDTLTVSLNSAIAVRENGEEVTKEECLKSFDSTEASAITKVVTEQLFQGLNSRESDILELRMDGYNQTEIARKLGLSRQRVSEIISLIRKNYIKKYSYNGGKSNE